MTKYIALEIGVGEMTIIEVKIQKSRKILCPICFTNVFKFLLPIKESRRLDIMAVVYERQMTSQ